ncbi:TIGR03617 family F420-dependent LLM class oxidoreductase [Nakamurella sp. A5-74]|uniref:TIGR03617 family F420-dependent LLM class oxidoreductase n=1 Tax=Nakamurella sp. A5-74 TaxID=3158264 RepID=A0AAU8DL59_9ACTN
MSAPAEPVLLVDQGSDGLPGLDLVEGLAAAAEEQGYAGFQVPETNCDPFIAAALAARATNDIQIATGIAVAFARTPMTVAMSANDVQQLSRGRFTLGLGSQIQAHIEKRFSMPWSRPAARMREFIRATRAIWSAWETGERLQFRGEFYTHTLMTPFFTPPKNPWGAPPIALAGVGPLMTEVAGEVADAFLAHGFTTRKYLEEVTIPALQRGRATAGRPAGSVLDLGISMPAFVVIGDDQAALDAAAAGVRKRIAFYGSTPAYLPVLEVHGWGGVQEKLYAASKRGQWDEMAGLITDEMVEAFAVIGDAPTVARELVSRYRGVLSRLSFYAPYEVDPQTWVTLLAELHRVTRP